MQTFTIVATLLAAFATSAAASNCKPGLDYCGSTLLGIGTPFLSLSPVHLSPFEHQLTATPLGNYAGQVDAATKAAKASSNVNAHLFSCIGGPDGAIQLIQQCGTCIDSGKGNSDVCAIQAREFTA